MKRFFTQHVIWSLGVWKFNCYSEQETVKSDKMDSMIVIDRLNKKKNNFMVNVSEI